MKKRPGASAGRKKKKTPKWLKDATTIFKRLLESQGQRPFPQTKLIGKVVDSSPTPSIQRQNPSLDPDPGWGIDAFGG